MALRKHLMRVDLHTHVGDVSDFTTPNQLDDAIKSMLTSAIIKGLDILGIVAHDGPMVGIRAQQIAQYSQIDLYVAAGEEYLSADGLRLLIFNLKNQLTKGLNSDEIIKVAHQNGAFVMAIDIKPRQANHINRIKGTQSAPDAVEIYNAAIGSYRDTHLDYPAFISSGAKNSAELEKINAYTLAHRKKLESLKIIPVGFGVDYTPKYLGGLPEQQAPTENIPHPIPPAHNQTAPLR